MKQKGEIQDHLTQYQEAVLIEKSEMQKQHALQVQTITQEKETVEEKLKDALEKYINADYTEVPAVESSPSEQQIQL